MTGRIVLFEGHRHETAQQLLPWLLNGRLEGDERAWVAQHVDGCRACRDDLETLRLLQAHCRQADVAADAADAAGSDAGWRRLRPRLKHAAGDGSWRRLSPRWTPGAHWMGWAVAAQALAILMLGLAVWRQSAEPAAPYRTLGRTPASSDGRLVVMFDAGLTEARLRALVTGAGARIVDGPNATGAYVLAVPADRLTAALATLRAAPDVRLVQSLGPERAQ